MPNNTYTPARGKRGQFLGGGRGDITGANYLRDSDAKVQRDAAVRETRNAIQSEPVELVSVPGGRTFAIPREAALYLIRVGMERD